MHLMLGLGVMAGGFRGNEQCYDATVASTLGTLLLLAMTGLIIPTASALLAKPVPLGVVKLSHGTAVIFIPMYLALLYFRFRSHSFLWDSDQANDLDEEDEVEEQKASIWAAIAMIAVATTLIGFNTLFATDSLDGLMSTTSLTRSFVGIVLLPLMTNDLAPIEAVYNDKMEICLQITVGKCVQTALFVTPVIVIIGWGMGIDEMTLSLDGFEVAALLASILYINFMTANGKSNW
jgi:Ca2+:H+ antiporter